MQLWVEMLLQIQRIAAYSSPQWWQGRHADLAVFPLRARADSGPSCCNSAAQYTHSAKELALAADLHIESHVMVVELRWLLLSVAQIMGLLEQGSRPATSKEVADFVVF